VIEGLQEHDVYVPIQRGAQRIFSTEYNGDYEILCWILDVYQPRNSIVFTQTEKMLAKSEGQKINIDQY
jgi:hypothetical protein